MTRHIHSDTRVPLNLLDGDFSEDTKVMPPERPPTEMTHTSYMGAKYRIMRVFATAVDWTHTVYPPTYEEVLDLAQQLEEARDLFPPPLRMCDMESAITDAPDTVMSRFNLEILYQKTRCVLHRRYLTEARTNTAVQQSRIQCLDAAMTLLRHQNTIHQACRPGGQLHQVRWYMSSLSKHDFLLAAMILCMELKLRLQEGEKFSNPANCPMPIRPQQLVDILAASYELWQAPTRKSADTEKACQVMAVMLKSVKAAQSTQPWQNALAARSPAVDDGAVPEFQGEYLLDRFLRTSLC